jgi:hypothetical protein
VVRDLRFNRASFVLMFRQQLAHVWPLI